MSINEQLKELYDSQWDELHSKLLEHTKKEKAKDRPSNPLLLQIDEDKYANSTIKLMFYGQEPNGWKNKLKTNTEDIIKNYKDFFLSGKALKEKTVYWRTFRLLIDKVESKYPNEKVYPIWNNVLKIGKEKGTGKPAEPIRIAERNRFKVAQKEIDIIKPDIVVFFSGPNYDYVLRNRFKNGLENISMVDVVGFKEKQLCRVKLSGCGNVFRTYHPNYLNRIGATERNIETIVNNITLPRLNQPINSIT